MINLRNINKAFRMGKVEVRALRGVSLKINPGEFVAIMGPSGSGKSTLLHVLGFLDKPDTGSYHLGGRDIANLEDDKLAILRNHLVGFVFQQFRLLGHMKALENAELPLIYAGKRHLKEKAYEKIKEVGLAERVSHRPNELSGGEQQRVAIARSLVNEPLIILADEPTGNLDTKTAEEIVSILKNLNQEGKTVIMVTHEREIAQQAKRIIHMRDGKIENDEIIGPGAKSLCPVPVNISIDGILSEACLAGKRVVFMDHFRQAVHAIISHKMRSILSVLGILIGVTAVIAMLALGEGAKENISQRLASLGSNLLIVRPGSRKLHGVSLKDGEVARFTLQDAKAIAKLIPVKRVSPLVRGRGQFVYGNKNWNTQIQGVGADYALMRASVPIIGRFFTEAELRMHKKVVLLGVIVAKELFGNVNPVGAAIKINRINFQVIGVLPEKGGDPWRSFDDVAVIPITTAMNRLLGKEYVDSIDVEIKDSSFMERAQNLIRELIVKRHRLSADDRDSFGIQNMSALRDTLEGTTRTMSWLLGSIAAISLLVGGIGIMNIMLVSVTERTAEIGLRKAIGARRKDIMSQFLIEAMLMTGSGGIGGILVGIGISILLSMFAGWTIRITPFSILLATTFSIAVGIGFGLWPARQAARLNPIEALRYE